MDNDTEIEQRAAECVRLAQLTENPALKSVLLNMAETFRRLADRSKQSLPEK
jgi:hypothetical protein